MYTRSARCAPEPLMTNPRTTFRTTAASLFAATQSPTFPSSTNDLPFLPEGSHDAESEIQLHAERLCNVGHIGGGPALEETKDRGACFRLGPLFDHHDAGFPELVHVGLHGPLHEFGPRMHPCAPYEVINLLKKRPR